MDRHRERLPSRSPSAHTRPLVPDQELRDEIPPRLHQVEAVCALRILNSVKSHGKEALHLLLVLTVDGEDLVRDLALKDPPQVSHDLFGHSRPGCLLRDSTPLRGSQHLASATCTQPTKAKHFNQMNTYRILSIWIRV